MFVTKTEFQKICELVWLSSVLRLIRKGVITENNLGLIDTKNIKNKKYMNNRKRKLVLSHKTEAKNINIMDICSDEIKLIGKKIVTKTEFKNMFNIVWLSSVSHLLKNKIIVTNSDGLIEMENEINKVYITNRKMRLASKNVKKTVVKITQKEKTK